MTLFCFIFQSRFTLALHEKLYPLKILSSSQFMGTFNFWSFFTDSISVNMKLLPAQSNKDFFSAPQQFLSLQMSREHNLRSHSRRLLELFVCSSLPDPLKNNCQLTCSPSLKKISKEISKESFNPLG